MRSNRVDHDARALVEREAANAGAERGERDRPELMGLCDLQRAAGRAVDERRRRPQILVHDRRVDDMPRRQPAARRDDAPARLDRPLRHRVRFDLLAAAVLERAGDAGAVGKPIGSDLREGKVTLPLIHLQQHSSGGAGRQIVRDIISSRSVTEEQWHDLLRCLKEHASIDYAYRRAVDFAERAKKPLYAFPPSSERDALLALPDYVLSRDR